MPEDIADEADDVVDEVEPPQAVRVSAAAAVAHDASTAFERATTVLPSWSSHRIVGLQAVQHCVSGDGRLYTAGVLLTVDALLSPEQLQNLRTEIQDGEWIDGQQTAGWHAREVKRNQQLSRQGPAYHRASELVLALLQSHQRIQMAVRPRHIHSLLFSRYGEGMEYGRHVDNAFMGDQGQFRSDISFTIFLNDPGDYDGGELVIEEPSEERSYKLGAGSVLLYPSSSLHRVNPVTRGERLVCVGWMESRIRDPGHREILYDIDTVRRALAAS